MQSYSKLLSEAKLRCTYVTLKFSKLRSNFSKHSENYFIYEYLKNEIIGKILQKKINNAFAPHVLKN
jgi:hypothetical protein